MTDDPSVSPLPAKTPDGQPAASSAPTINFDVILNFIMYVSFKIKRMKALKCKNNANGQKEDLPPNFRAPLIFCKNTDYILQHRDETYIND